MNVYNDRCGCAARRAEIGRQIDRVWSSIMASRGDLKTQQERIRIKAEHLAVKVKQMELADKARDLQARLRRMGGR